MLNNVKENTLLLENTSNYNRNKIETKTRAIYIYFEITLSSRNVCFNSVLQRPFRNNKCKINFAIYIVSPRILF